MSVRETAAKKQNSPSLQRRNLIFFGDNSFRLAAQSPDDGGYGLQILRKFFPCQRYRVVACLRYLHADALKRRFLQLRRPRAIFWKYSNFDENVRPAAPATIANVRGKSARCSARLTKNEKQTLVKGG